MDGKRVHPRLELSDYRRRVNDLYASVRSLKSDPERAWDLWRAGRDDLFAHHPQSPLSSAQRRTFPGLDYYAYNPDLRISVTVDETGAIGELEVPLEEDGLMHMVRIGRLEFELEGHVSRLALYWITGYGGGLFLPFRDATNGSETFGGGRYLLDAIKGADLGRDDDRLVLDFNFAYNPSCAYSPQWHCPLPPSENWLEVAIRGGEKRFPRHFRDGDH
jgi:hypothetical protein